MEATRNVHNGVRTGFVHVELLDITHEFVSVSYL